jgi:hypothetical protein
MGRKLVAVMVVLATLAGAGGASASPRVTYGVKDDAWLAFGPGSLKQRIRTLDRLGVGIVSYTLRWDQIAVKRPKYPRYSGARAYTWGSSDGVLQALHRHRIPALVGIWGTPRWANGGRGPNFAPTSPKAIRDFAHAAAQRFPWVHRWLIWNEPNQSRFLRPTMPAVYVNQILNPAYAALHASSETNLVGGGVTAPRGDVSPVAWIHGMRSAGATLDAYAHHPYPLDPHRESPVAGGCSHCRTITMATLGRLERATAAAWGSIPLWLTEYGYQTNPPTRRYGVSWATQARYEGEAALRVYQAPRVQMLIHFLVRDDRPRLGWKSGLFTANGVWKPAAHAFPLPLAQVSRSGTQTVLWGQVRPHHGKRAYRLEQLSGGRWVTVGGTASTNAAGFLRRTVTARPGATFRVWSVADGMSGAPLAVR